MTTLQRSTKYFKDNDGYPYPKMIQALAEVYAECRKKWPFGLKVCFDTMPYLPHLNPEATIVAGILLSKDVDPHIDVVLSKALERAKNPDPKWDTLVPIALYRYLVTGECHNKNILIQEPVEDASDDDDMEDVADATEDIKAAEEAKKCVNVPPKDELTDSTGAPNELDNHDEPVFVVDIVVGKKIPGSDCYTGRVLKIHEKQPGSNAPPEVEIVSNGDGPAELDPKKAMIPEPKVVCEDDFSVVKRQPAVTYHTARITPFPGVEIVSEDDPTVDPFWKRLTAEQRKYDKTLKEMQDDFRKERAAAEKKSEEVEEFVDCLVDPVLRK